MVGGDEASEGSSAGAKREFVVGTNAHSARRDGMRMESPLRDGIVADWDAVEALIDHSYKNCLTCNPAEHPLLMAEPSFNTEAAREKMTELAFEKFSTPAFFLGKNAVLSAFASGRGSALVLDVGGGMSSATAVHDGYVLNKPLKRSSLAGDKLNELLLKALELRDPAPAVRPIYTLKRTPVGPDQYKLEPQDYPGTHPSYHRYMQLQTMKDIKENLCRCSLLAPSAGVPLDVSAWDYEMPDRSAIDFWWERLNLPELLLTPALLRSHPPTWLRQPPSAAAADAPAATPETPTELAEMVPQDILGLPEMVSECIRACDTDTRRDLWGNIIVTGGTSLLPGLTERLHFRLNELGPQMSFKVKMIATTVPSERRFSTWIGGSILASLGSFQQLWMSKQEYEEQGASGIHRKCP